MDGVQRLMRSLRDGRIKSTKQAENLVRGRDGRRDMRIAYLLGTRKQKSGGLQY